MKNFKSHKYHKLSLKMFNSQRDLCYFVHVYIQNYFIVYSVFSLSSRTNEFNKMKVKINTNARTIQIKFRTIMRTEMPLAISTLLSGKYSKNSVFCKNQGHSLFCNSVQTLGLLTSASVQVRCLNEKVERTVGPRITKLARQF